MLTWLMWGALLVSPADDFKSVAKELEKAASAGQPAADRQEAIRRIANYRGPDATKALLRALDESTIEQKSLDVVFGKLTEELAKFLDGREDIRLAPESKKEQVEQRKEIGRRVIQESDVAELLVESLSVRKDEESIAILAKAVNQGRDWRKRTLIIDALGRMGAVAALDAVHKSAGDKDARVRMLAADALGAIGSATSVETLAELLEDEEWQVRAFTVEALGKIGSPQAVPYLINALARETGRLQKEISDRLGDLTGQAIGESVAQWQAWWEDHKETFLANAPEAGKASKVRLAAAKPKKDPGFSYYGIQTKSDKVVFILDISDSMNDDADETELPADGVPKRTGNLKPKIQVAKDQLMQAIVDLPEASTFNIVTYNKFVRAWRESLVKATKRNKNDAITFIAGTKATESTNIFEALELAFNFAGQNLGDRHYASPVDTIFFLTDGKATAGRIQETDEILDEIKRINRVGKITIHTIGVGYLHDRPFLKALAGQNGGTYVDAR